MWIRLTNLQCEWKTVPKEYIYHTCGECYLRIDKIEAIEGLKAEVDGVEKEYSRVSYKDCSYVIKESPYEVIIKIKEVE